MSFSCARIFSDHMVLQRNQSIAVFGTAPAGACVAAELNGSYAEGIADADGKWLIRLPAMDARGALELRVTCGEQCKVFHDVVLGEVWLAGGQSNMEFELYKAKGGFVDIANSADDDLRFYQVELTETNEERDRLKRPAPDGWVASGPEYAASFSAVAYYFAVKLRGELNVPVGIVGCCWGGTSASCWLSREKLEEDEDLKIYLEEYERDRFHGSTEEYLAARAVYDAQVAAYEEQLKALCEREKDEERWRREYDQLVYPWPPVLGERNYQRPNGLYETMVCYAAPYTMRGALWYQGEGDSNHAHLYARLLGKVLEQWRQDFMNPELFMGVVQLTGYAGENGEDDSWGVVRDQQRIVGSGPNAAVAITYDVGMADNIHPIEKRTVGNRLADQILAHCYGKKLDVSLADPESVSVQDGDLVLRFTQALCCTGKAQGFQVHGADGKWTYADAEVSGDTVVLRGNAAAKAVRYAYTNWTDANVYQTNGIPLPPFERTL